ncbi:MAG: AMP-binding protein [Anaerolinea sp.]|nr:AMP-binding protein [Anaerolinea sp.]
MMMNERLQETVRWAYAQATAVRDHFDQAGIKPDDIQTMADLARIPVMSKDAVIAMQQANPPFGGLLAVPMSDLRHIFFSPGPLYEPDNGDDPSLLRMTQLCLQQTGFQAGDVVLNALSYHLVPAGLLLDQALVGLGCTVVPGGVGNSDLQLKMMADLGVTGYVGTPSFLMSLIQKAEENGRPFSEHFKLRRALVTAEPLPPSLRQTLTEQYGLTVGNGYATAELGFLALNVGGGLAMQLLPEPIVQIVDPDSGQTVGPGEAGEVVVTNFSHAYPLIRLGTGDLALNLDPNPGQSRQEERAIILVGRCGEAVKVRGMFVHPNQLRFAVGQVAGVAAAQAVITRPENRDHFLLQVVLAGGEDQATAVDKLTAAVQATCRVRPDHVNIVSSDSLTAGSATIQDERRWT